MIVVDVALLCIPGLVFLETSWNVILNAIVFEHIKAIQFVSQQPVYQRVSRFVHSERSDTGSETACRRGHYGQAVK